MSLNCKTVADVTAAIEEYGIEIIDLRFTDVYGQWHHFSLPTEAYDEKDIFSPGLGL